MAEPEASNFYFVNPISTRLRYFIINTKNYVEASGESVLRLATEIKRVSTKRDFNDRVTIALATPAFCIYQIRQKFPDLMVFGQHLDDSSIGSTTGYLVPEIAKSFGANGSLLNHSEHRIPVDVISRLVSRMNDLGLQALICARDSPEVANLAGLEPKYVAIEPPELIGSGRAVSTSRPDLISESKAELDKIKRTHRPIFLCGAGIVSRQDVEKAVELGADGVLVASGVVKSHDWAETIESLAEGLIA